MASSRATSFAREDTDLRAATPATPAIKPVLVEASDEELMSLVQARDQGAFTRLLQRHLMSIHSYVYRMTRNRSDAEDIAQETFLRLWNRASTFQPGRVKVTTWLHRIAHNLCVDEFRKRRETVDGGRHEAFDDAPSASALSLTEERRRAVHAAIADLPERQRSALALCQLEGWSNKQAAQILDISVDALESLIARARRTLKTSLRVYFSPEFSPEFNPEFHPEPYPAAYPEEGPEKSDPEESAL